MIPPSPPGLSLDAVLPVVLPLLSPGLADADALPPLYVMAQGLPPVARGGFECRLSAGSPALDLHQVLWRAHGEQHLLVDYLAARDRATRSHPAWTSLQRFATWWADAKSDAAEQVDALFLELDAEHDGPAAPSVFCKLGATGGITAARATGVVQEILDVLGLPAGTSRLTEVFAVCEARSARITHVGMMLARETRALRINVAVGAAEAVPPFLQAVGWDGDRDVVAREVEWLRDYVDQVVCCLDVDDRLHPHVGLECFIEASAQSQGRWRRFVDALVERGLCDAAKGENLLAFHRLLTPVTSAVTSAVAWPDALIVASLLDPDGLFSAFVCRLHHVKLTFIPGRPTAAKGYLGFAHRWLGAGAGTASSINERR